jgi:hypothetical protein
MLSVSNRVVTFLTTANQAEKNDLLSKLILQCPNEANSIILNMEMLPWEKEAIALLKNREKIRAIKVIRENAGLGLKEAKMKLDDYEDMVRAGVL